MTIKPIPETPNAPKGYPPRSRELRLVISGAQQRAMQNAEASADAALAAALAEDLDGNFESMVRRFQDRLFTFALRLTASREDAEEVAQDAFVRAYRALKTYPAERV